MRNKIKHFSKTQSIPGAEFLPIRRGESPFYGNLNRPAQSAYAYSDTIANIQSWGGLVSILPQADQAHVFSLYEIAKIQDGELLAEATMVDDATTRYGIVVAEAEFDIVSGLYVNTVVCTFCPNFVYPSSATTPPGIAGDSLYLGLSGLVEGSSDSLTMTRALAKKTGTRSIFFSGTAALW